MPMVTTFSFKSSRGVFNLLSKPKAEIGVKGATTKSSVAKYIFKPLTHIPSSSYEKNLELSRDGFFPKNKSVKADLEIKEHFSKSSTCIKQ